MATSSRFVELSELFYFSPIDPAYGADKTGGVETSSAVQSCINAAKAVRGKLRLPPGDYLIGTELLIDSPIDFGGPGKLVAQDGANLRSVLRVTADETIVGHGLQIDQSGVTSNTSDGIGILWGANDGTIQGAYITGEGANGGSLSNCVKVTGVRNEITDVHAKDPGYAGFRDDGDRNVYTRCLTRTLSRTDSARGFVSNSTTAGSTLTLRDCDFEIESSHAESVGININGTPGSEIGHVLLEGVRVDIYGGSNNSLKVSEVDLVTARGCRFRNGPVATASGVGVLWIEASWIYSTKITMGSEIEELVLRNVKHETGASSAIEFIGQRMTLEDYVCTGFTSSLIDNQQPWGNVVRIVMKRLRAVGNSASNIFLWSDSGSGTIDASGKLVFDFLTSVLDNSGAGGAEFHTNSDKRRLFRTLDDSATRYRASSPPTNQTWSEGDEVENGTPDPSDVKGWVCTDPGTPGTWKSYGSIAA